jgi:hypothetical protein
MAKVHFTTHLQRFFPTIQQGITIEASTVADVVTALDRCFPGLGDYVVDERGTLRKHVNIFVDDELVLDRERLTDRVGEKTRVFIFQALSGG